MANKYKIIDTLFKNELQNIYVAEEIDGYSSDQYIVNEVLDGSIIYAIKEVFNEEARDFLKNFVDYFYESSNFYIVSTIPTGSTLDSYLSSNNLRISDKMYITESLLTTLIMLEGANRLIKYHLLNIENITLAGFRTVSFNLDIKFDKEALYFTEATIINKLGEVICCIFANSPQATLETDKDNLPPAIAAIVLKCKNESYSSVTQVFKDFKSTLLHSTFIDNVSINKQIMNNLQKASRERKTRPIKRIVALLILFALLSGVFYGISELGWRIPAFVGNKNIAEQQNQVPIAKFNMSKSKVYLGDTVDFTASATDLDLDDNIASYEWSISRNDDMYILFSRDQNPSFAFDRDGDYIVSLIVKDSSGLSSEAFKLSFKVYPKEEIPVTPIDGEDVEEVILK